MKIDRIRTQRHVDAMVALDNFDLIAARIQKLLSWGRRIAITHRYTYTDSPPELAVGLTLDPEGHGDGISVRVDAASAHLAVALKPGLTAGFGVGAYSGDADKEAGVWARYHAGSDYRRDMTMVTIVGGLGGDGPARDDLLVIRFWTSSAVCIERVVGFDTDAYWAERDRADVVSAEVDLLREAAALPEPPDRAYVALEDPAREGVAELFERDDNALAEEHEDHWYDARGDAWTWQDVLAHGGKAGRRVVRLYPRDDLPMSAVAALDAAERAEAL